VLEPEPEPAPPRAEPFEPPPTTEAVQTVARRNWTGGLLALAAAFVVLIALGTAVVLIGDRLRAPASDRALETVEAAPDAESATVDIVDGGTATAHWSPSLGTAVLVTVGLERAGADRDYQVWFQRGGESIAAGHFDTGADGNSTTVLEGDIQEGDVITVTVEPAGGADQPSGEPIIEIPTATL
jgi:anti-sigma-K factor RskA